MSRKISHLTIRKDLLVVCLAPRSFLAKFLLVGRAIRFPTERLIAIFASQRPFVGVCPHMLEKVDGCCELIGAKGTHVGLRMHKVLTSLLSAFSWRTFCIVEDGAHHRFRSRILFELARGIFFVFGS
jgi:hypothetical protein